MLILQQPKNTLKCMISYYIEVGKYIKKKLKAK